MSWWTALDNSVFGSEAEASQQNRVNDVAGNAHRWQQLVDSGMSAEEAGRQVYGAPQGPVRKVQSTQGPTRTLQGLVTNDDPTWANTNRPASNAPYFTDNASVQNWLTGVTPDEMKRAGFSNFQDLRDFASMSTLADMNARFGPGSKDYTLPDQPNYGTGNAAIDTVINAVGGIGAHAGTGGAGMGVTGGPVGVPGPNDRIRANTDLPNSGQKLDTALPSNPLPQAQTPTNQGGVNQYPGPGSAEMGAPTGGSNYSQQLPSNREMGAPYDITKDPDWIGRTPVHTAAAGAPPPNGQSPSLPSGPMSPDWYDKHKPGVAGAPTGAAAAGGMTAAQMLQLAKLGFDVVDGVIVPLNNGKALGKAEAEAAAIQDKYLGMALDRHKTQFGISDTLNSDIHQQAREDNKPWYDRGVQANEGLVGMVDNNKPFGMSDFNVDPGYSFRLKEGLKALENSASARGGLMSGNTGKALQNYGQEAASQEYQNAFNRYQTQRDSKINVLQGLSNRGQTAANQMGQAGQNYASQSQQNAQNYAGAAGHLLVGQGNALAQGKLGTAVANASGYTGAARGLSQSLGDYLDYQHKTDMVNALKGNR